MARQEYEQNLLQDVVANFDKALTHAQARHAAGNMQNALAFAPIAHEGQAANVASTGVGKSGSLEV